MLTYPFDIILGLKGPNLGPPDGPITIGPNTIGPIGPYLAINMHFGALTSLGPTS